MIKKEEPDRINRKEISKNYRMFLHTGQKGIRIQELKIINIRQIIPGYRPNTWNLMPDPLYNGWRRSAIIGTGVANKIKSA